MEATAAPASTGPVPTYVAPPQLERLLTVQQVQLATSFSRTTIYRMVADGTFPEPMKIGKARIAWRSSAVRDWMAERPSAGLRHAA